MIETEAATDAETDACAVAHGATPGEDGNRTLLAVFASPVADFLLRYASDSGFRPVLLEPDTDRATVGNGVRVLESVPDWLNDTTDVVVTDHHREELGPVLRDVLARPVRWIGVMGNPRHPAPHIDALAALGVPAADIDRVHRPIGLNIGSHRPAEIAIATLAGVIADRNKRPGGFEF